MNICFIDFETTGIDVFKDNPIEIGCILVNEKSEIIKKFHSFIYPRTQRHFSASSKNIHGLNISKLKQAPSQRQVLNDYFKLVGTDYRFAGWNINFDVTFFRRMCHLNNFMKEYNCIMHRHIDIQSITFFLMMQNILPKDLESLEDLVSFFHLKRNQNHNAIEDAELTLNIYKKLVSLEIANNGI